MGAYQSRTVCHRKIDVLLGALLEPLVLRGEYEDDVLKGASRSEMESTAPGLRHDHHGFRYVRFRADCTSLPTPFGANRDATDGRSDPERGSTADWAGE